MNESRKYLFETTHQLPSTGRNDPHEAGNLQTCSSKISTSSVIGDSLAGTGLVHLPSFG